MTGKQIRAAQDALPRFVNMTDEQKREYAELSCREMINSIMIYGDINSPYDESTDTLYRYLDDRWKEDGMFFVPRERIIELVKEQQADFAKARVIYGTYTDYEGCTYNSCVWEDGQ